MTTEQMIEIGKKLVGAIEIGIAGAKALTNALEAGKEKMLDAIADAEKLVTKLDADRTAADTALDKKFRGGDE